MSEPFIGEIRIVGFNFAPRGWAHCQGQLLPIAQYQALFAILGTTYGGDGRVTFALPDFRGRIPAHPGPVLTLGAQTGTETVTLTPNQIPGHDHAVPASSLTANAVDPTGGVPARAPTPHYAAAGAPTPMPAAAVDETGGTQPHDNLSPVLVMNFVIALEGIFPPRP